MKKLQHKIRALPLREGSSQTGIPGITAYQFTTDKIEMPQTETPYLYIVLDGVLRLHTPSGIMDYMAGQYSISKIDTPMYGSILTFSGSFCRNSCKRHHHNDFGSGQRSDRKNHQRAAGKRHGQAKHFAF